jgi:hypothetical protein
MNRVTDNHITVHGIAELVFCRFRFLSRIYNANVGAVDLPATREGPFAGKKLEKAAAILQNVLRSIVVEPGKTQGVRRHVADATETRGEAINKSIAFEGSTNKSANSIAFAPVETVYA